MIIEISTKNLDALLVDKPDFCINRLVVGWFDGLHAGHLRLFAEDLANTSVLTFVNHPTKKECIYSDDERISQLQKLGIKDIYIYDLKSNLCSIEFIEKILIRLKPKLVVVGEGFVFGSDKKDANFLAKHFKLEIIPRLENYSSTIIRDNIKKADIETANNLLVWPFYRTGFVERGSGIGEKVLGFKTANVAIDSELCQIPEGVYITKTVLKSEKYKSITFVGKSKTFKNAKTSKIETHIINYEKENFYDEEIKVIFYKKIADVKKFIFKKSLIRAIKKYIDISKKYRWMKSTKY